MLDWLEFYFKFENSWLESRVMCLLSAVCFYSYVSNFCVYNV